MTRDFNERDRKKKQARIRLPENPAGLSLESLARLERAVTESLRQEHLPCPVAWRIAKDLDIPRIAVGAAMDKLGARVTDCQIGFFKVDKTPYQDDDPQQPSPELAAGLQELVAARNLTCAEVFALAHRLKTTPLTLSDAANRLGLKIRACQLGCF